MRRNRLFINISNLFKLFIFLIIVCSNFINAQETKLEVIISDSSKDFDENKPGDVLLYKNPWYTIIFFRIENDTLRHYKVLYMDDEPIESAFYEWENDSTILIRFHYNKDKKDVRMRASGFRKSTGGCTTLEIVDNWNK